MKAYDFMIFGFQNMYLTLAEVKCSAGLATGPEIVPLLCAGPV